MPTTRGVQFVGRSDLLALLSAELADASRGRLSVALLSGEAGIGKSRLAAELLRVHPNVTALSGRAYSLASNESLGLWVDAIETHLRALSPEEVAELCGTHRSDLAALLPSVAALGDTTSGNPPRSQLLDGLAAVLSGIARRGPVIVVLDDVHLADGSSWAALGYLVRHLADAPILIVLAARPVELGDDPIASDIVLALDQEGFLRRFPVTSLDRDEVEELATIVLDQRVDEKLVTWLMDRSGGTPLFAGGLLRALVDEEADLSDPELRSLPEDLTARIESRLRQLQPGDRATLELLAVVGGRVEFDDLIALTKRPTDELIESIERLLRLRLLAEFQLGAVVEYEIYHPLVEEVIYESVAAVRRRALHRFVARSLLSSGRLGSAAGHFVRSATIGDAEAIEALTDALHQADSREHHREALALLDALLDILPAGDARWLEVYDAMNVRAEWVVDHRADNFISTGLRAMRRIDQLVRSEPASRQGASKFRLGTFLAWGSEDIAGGRAMIAEAALLFEAAGDSQSMLLAQNELGYVTAISGNHRALQPNAVEVFSRAEAAGDRFAQMQALCSWAHAVLWAGHVQEAAPVLHKALTLAREDSRLYRVSYLLGQTAYERALMGDFASAHELLTEGREANAAYLDSAWPDFAAFTEWLCGRLTTGLGIGREMSAWDGGGGFSRRRVFGATLTCFCALELGAVDEAVRIARTSKASFEGLEWWCHSSMPAWMEGAICSATGDYDSALEVLAPAAAYMDTVGTHLWSALIMFDVAEAAVYGSRPDALSTALDTAVWVEPTVASAAQGAIERFCRGASALAEGRPDEAAADLADAAAVFDRCGWVMHAARVRVLLARALAPTNRDAASEELRGAISVFAASGAERRRAAAADALAIVATRGRRTSAAVSGIDALTGREREVAVLASEGASSRDIAATLFIGERTVETHLGNIYAKLGVRGRTQLALMHLELAGSTAEQNP